MIIKNNCIQWKDPNALYKVISFLQYIKIHTNKLFFIYIYNIYTSILGALYSKGKKGAEKQSVKPSKVYVKFS